MPHLVEMQRKHGAEGLVVLSVVLDRLNDPDEPAKDVRKRVLDFLGSVDSKGVTHFHLDMPDDDERDKRFRMIEGPFFYIFDRRGFWELDSDPQADKMDALMLDRLKEK